MTGLPWLAAMAEWLAGRLVSASVQGPIVILFVWLACHRRIRLSPAMQAALWWLAALKIVMTLVPLPAVSIPILPAASAVGRVSATPVQNETLNPPVGAEAVSGGLNTLDSVVPAGVTIWLLAMAWHIARLIAAHRAARAIVRRSTPWVADAGTVTELAAAIGLGQIPAIHVSDDVTAPLLLGIRRPLVLIPADGALSPHELRMALGHEFMHVRRHDLVLAWVPALAERLFFFHPLIRRAAREYVTAREAACDAALVRALDVPAADYGRLLVRFGIRGRRSVFAAGGASTSASILRRRLDMLQQLSNGGSRQWGWIAGAAMVLAIVPSQLVAQAPPVLPIPPAISKPAPEPRQPVVSLVPEPDVSLEPPLEEVRENAQAEPSVRTEDFLRGQLADVERALSDIEHQKLIERISRESEMQKLIEQQARARTEVETALESNRLAEVMSRLTETERRLAESRRAQEQGSQDRLSDQSPAARERVLRDQLRELERAINVLSRRYQELQKQFEDLSKQYKSF